MPFYPIVPSKTALIVFDMTRDVVDNGGQLYSSQAKEVVARIAPLIQRCRNAGMPVIFVRQVLAADGSDAGLLNSIYPRRTAYQRGDPGIEIYPGLGMQVGDWLIDKNRFSAFWGTGLHDRLLQRGIDTVIITGCSTAVGCETTARDATTRDLKVIFVSDGTVTRPLRDLGWGAFTEDEVHRMTLTVLGHTFARIASIQEISKEIP
jgi:ureidoacrylate peracid hydrolase